MSWVERVRAGGHMVWPRVLLIVLTLAVVVALGVVAATSTTAFSPYNPAWDGTTDFREDIETDPTTDGVVVRETDQYAAHDPATTVAVVIAPRDTYTGADARRLREFVATGGTLVVLENFGSPGNRLLADVGAEARVDGRLLRDDRHHFRGPTMPIATNVTNHTLTTGVDQLTLNYATAVQPGNATVLVATSEFAYLGTENGTVEEADELRSYPIATVEPVGDGQVVVVGDPSLVINAMYAEPDNTAFSRGLYADADHVLFDVSHAASVPPVIAALATLRRTPLLQAFLGLGAIGTLAALARWRVRPLLARLRRRAPGGGSDTPATTPRDGPDPPTDRTRPPQRAHRAADRDRGRITALNHPRGQRENDE